MKNLVKLLILTVLLMSQFFIFNSYLVAGRFKVHIYIYVLLLVQNYNTTLNIILSFAIGLLLDYMSNSFGVIAFALTGAGYSASIILNQYKTKNKSINSTLLPMSISSFGFYSFTYITFALCFVHECMFSLINIGETGMSNFGLIEFFGSVVCNFVIVLLLDGLKLKFRSVFGD